jgi:hypothetical protein
MPPTHISLRHLRTFLLLCLALFGNGATMLFSESERTTLNSALVACKLETFLWGEVAYPQKTNICCDRLVFDRSKHSVNHKNR